MKCQLCNRKEATLMWFVMKVCDDCYKKQRAREQEIKETNERLRK